MQETPEADDAARTIAEAVYAAYERQATTRIHPAKVQTLLARLAETIRPEIMSPPRSIIAAVNVTLDAWEQTNHEVQGPRVASLDVADGSIAMSLPQRLV
ncbi:hypothetical protein [Methylobacterium sp.]|uniref:hypothetical protein n=1 Tax=Methylobacterium sp. TaxID=409 RepID=UPI0025F47B7A|nr:hypothetical protein [Methylobacterium sp.]